MKKRYVLSLAIASALLMGAGIPNFFAGLIGDNVHKYCEEKSDQEQVELIQSVNLYTGTHKVVVVCGERVASANTDTQADSNSSRIRHK